MTPEFSRPVAVASVPSEGRMFEVAANAAERARLAIRFELPEIERLACRFQLHPLQGGGLGAEAVMTARVRLVCVVSDDTFEADVEEAFNLRFVPLAALSAEIALDGPDDIPIVGASVDLGEAAAEQLALALPAYPRHPDLPEPAEPIEGTAASPFTALKRRPA